MAVVTPTDWELLPIGSIGDLYTGTTPPTHDRSLYGDEYPFISPADLGSEKYIRKAEKNLSAKGYLTTRQIPRGSLLFVCIGSTIGKTGIVTKSSSCNQQINYLVPFEEYHSEYLYYALGSIAPLVKEQAGEQAVPMVNKSEFAKFTIPVPKIDEQIAIAKTLSSIDELIAVTAQLLNKKERIFEGALQTEFSKSSGATLTIVSDICEVTKGSAVKYDKDFVQGSFGFLNGGINFSGLTEFANDSGDTVVVSEGGNSCGFVNYILKPFWCGGHAYRLLGFEGNQKYLYYALKKSEKEIMNLRVGSGLPNVQKKNLSDFKTPIHPDPKKQEEIVNFLDSLTGEIDILKSELAKYECIKQGMAHDLLTGKVRLV